MQESFEKTLEIIPQGIMVYSEAKEAAAKCEFMNKEMKDTLIAQGLQVEDGK